MDKIKKNPIIESGKALYAIKDIMENHNLTAEQTLTILFMFHDIECESTITDATSLVNKGLIVKGKVNAFLLFGIDKPKQLTLDMKVKSKPKSTEFTLDRAHRLEKEFVISEFATDEEKKKVADKHFKGDIVLARYFIIFKSLFPNHKTFNEKWNKKYGFVYEGMSLWDDHPRVSKKFIEIYKKLDIGIFLEATYKRVKDSIDLEQERCFMQKPFKHLLAFESYYRAVEKDLKNKKKRSEKDTKEKINKLKV